MVVVLEAGTEAPQNETQEYEIETACENTTQHIHGCYNVHVKKYVVNMYCWKHWKLTKTLKKLSKIDNYPHSQTILLPLSWCNAYTLKGEIS